MVLRESAYDEAPNNSEASDSEVPSRGAGGKGALGRVAGKVADYRA